MVARVEVPLAVRVPCVESDDVETIDPAVRELMNALVVVALPTMSDVKLASVATREEKNPLVLVLLAIVPLVEYSVVAVSAVEDAVASVV